MKYDPSNIHPQVKREDAKEVLKPGPPMGRAGTVKRYKMEPAGPMPHPITLKRKKK